MFLEGNGVWKTIITASRGARGRRYVASPYLTGGMSQKLGLGRGDVLLCALTLANCRSGSIDPAEVKRAMARGVRVYALDQLHAKVFLLGRRAIVGSANMTSRSQRVLDEAAVLITEAVLVRQVRQWFEARLHSPVQPEWLKRCAEVYRPPRLEITLPSRRRKTQATARRGGVLLATLVPRIDTDAEAELVAAAEKTARRRLVRPRRSDLDSIRWDGAREFRPGDEIIQILRDGTDTWVHPHAKVVYVRRVRRPSGGTRKYVFLELPRSYRRLRFSAFAKMARQVGLRVTRLRTRLVTDPVAVHGLLSITAPEKMRRG